LPSVVLTAMADAVENGTLRNRERLSAMIDTAITQALGGQQMQALLQQAGSREDVMKGFKKENPALTDAQLKEIADQWEANKDVVKDKTAGAGEEFQRRNPTITDEQVAVINEMHDKHKDVIKDQHAKKAGNLTDVYSTALLDLYASLAQAEEMVENAAAKCWKAWKAVEGSQGGGVKNEMRQLAPSVLDIVSACRKQKQSIQHLRGMAWIDVRTAAEGDVESKFEKGKPADPTENMTPEQKAEWKKQNDEHKDEFTGGK
jgi:hypothetical protein